MRYRESGSLDASGVRDTRGRGGGGRGLAVGGGGLGLVGLVVVVLLQVLGGGDGGGGGPVGAFSGLGQDQAVDNSALAEDCRTGADANESVECAVVADVESIQDYWSGVLGEQYVPTETTFFTGSVQTACGGASSGSGPFYCPADQLVYIDLTFFDDMREQFGAQGGLFVDAYIIAHEYGHHVQNLLGTNARVTPGESGPTSGSVRLELQADCYAGAWAQHAETVPDDSGEPLIADITDDDIDRALDAAARIGDDYIQENLGDGTVDQEAFTHGSSEQRQKWFRTGYETGDPARCDTFATEELG